MPLFTENDLRLLEKTISIRERLVDNLLKNDLPTKARDIDSFTNLLESIDRSILGKAKIHVEDSAVKANEETKEVLKAILLDLHKQPEFNTNLDIKEAPKFESKNIDINEGELIVGQDTIDIKSVLEK